MRPETEARIRTVQKFGKNARQFCALAATLIGIGMVGNWAKIFLGPRGGDTVLVVGPRGGSTSIQLSGFFSINGDQLTTGSSKLFAFVCVTVAAGVFFWMLFHLYRLFKQLEAGSIYTGQNVYHLRWVGWLSMAAAVIPLIILAVSLGLAELGFIDGNLVTSAAPGGALLGQPLGGVISASLILLASWIMDVGREVTDDAEAMRREADLVI
jgi:hypothetical protein